MKGNKKKNTYTYWFAASSIFYLTAIIWYFALDNRSIAIMFGCLGSAALCMGAAMLNKYNKECEENTKDKKEKE